MTEAEDLLRRHLDGLPSDHPERAAIEKLIAQAETHNKRPAELDKEWQGQADQLAYLFAEILGMSRQEYTDSLPPFPSQPEEYQGRLDIPVIVQTPQPNLSLTQILDIAGIRYNREDVVRFEDWERGKFTTPDKPYTTWLDDGSRNLGNAVEIARDNLAPFERGGTHVDGVGLFLKDPDILKDHFLDFPGSQFGSDDAPCLDLDGRGPWLRLVWVDDPDPGFGSVVAGREIRVGA